ncbi:MAG TPA: zinc ribbon domain-containing protein [Candidatus Anoxymicrobiaceae bacterium]
MIPAPGLPVAAQVTSVSLVFTILITGALAYGCWYFARMSGRNEALAVVWGVMCGIFAFIVYLILWAKDTGGRTRPVRVDDPYAHGPYGAQGLMPPPPPSQAYAYGHGTWQAGAPAPEQAGKGAGSFCHRCGTRQITGDQFCPNCGEKIHILPAAAASPYEVVRPPAGPPPSGSPPMPPPALYYQALSPPPPPTQPGAGLPTRKPPRKEPPPPEASNPHPSRWK